MKRRDFSKVIAASPLAMLFSGDLSVAKEEQPLSPSIQNDDIQGPSDLTNEERKVWRDVVKQMFLECVSDNLAVAAVAQNNVAYVLEKLMLEKIKNSLVVEKWEIGSSLPREDTRIQSADLVWTSSKNIWREGDLDEINKGFHTAADQYVNLLKAVAYRSLSVDVWKLEELVVSPRMNAFRYNKVSFYGCMKIVIDDVKAQNIEQPTTSLQQ